jgi:hypothetical protein
MRSKIAHMFLVAMLIGCVTLAAVVKTYAISDDKFIDVPAVHWGIAQNQTLRICTANVSPSLDGKPTEQFSFVFFQIKNQLGQSIIETRLLVPANNYRCADFSRSSLIAAGLVPEPTGRVDFMVTFQATLAGTTVGANETLTVGGARESIVGSIETLDSNTGQTQAYERFLIHTHAVHTSLGGP